MSMAGILAVMASAWRSSISEIAKAKNSRLEAGSSLVYRRWRGERKLASTCEKLMALGGGVETS
jgi:hypothetical protein